MQETSGTNALPSVSNGMEIGKEASNNACENEVSFA